MAVVQIRIVRVSVPQWRVPMRVGVRLAGRIVRPVRVLVVRVMNVPMLVLERLMDVLVLVPLGEVQPDADAH